MEVHESTISKRLGNGVGGGWPLGYLVGGFNPFEKYARNIGSSPQVRVNIKK